jgi:RHS repeat-associated protein
MRFNFSRRASLLTLLHAQQCLSLALLVLFIAIVSTPSRATTFNATFQRDRLGLELERQLPGGIRARWERDSLGRPVRHEIWRGNQYHSAKQYIWDVNDRLTKIIDAMSGPVEYQHDALGNLAAAKYADGKIDLRMPDAVGNLFRTADRSDRKYGPAGQLLESRDARGVTRYQYDPEGNLTKKIEPDGATWLYEWNGAGMLAKVTRPNGHIVEFQYDALARRTLKSYRGKTTRWIWDGNVPLHEWVERAPDAVDEDFSRAPREDDSLAANEKALKALLAGRPANGPPSDEARDEQARAPGSAEAPITWLFEPESFAPLAKLVNGEQFAIVTDHLGTPSAMFDAQGREVWGADIDAYGDLRNLRGERQACPFRWPGQYEDEETGLYYNRFRHYDPATGEYVCQDPIRTRGGAALYAYVPDPLTWLDVLALSGCDPTDDRVIMIDPATLRWSQTTAGGGGRAASIRASMAEQGWNGPPIDVVRTTDGLVTVDHTRAAIALEQGIPLIPVKVHAPDEALPADMLSRPWNRTGATASTWGEAVRLRGAGQAPPIGPTGSPKPPRLPKG